MRGTAATLAAGALLVLFWWMAAIVSRQHGTTADEIFHVTASYSDATAFSRAQWSLRSMARGTSRGCSRRTNLFNRSRSGAYYDAVFGRFQKAG
jgi:hypothetical protein